MTFWKKLPKKHIHDTQLHWAVVDPTEQWMDSNEVEHEGYMTIALHMFEVDAIQHMRAHFKKIKELRPIFVEWRR